MFSYLSENGTKVEHKPENLLQMNPVAFHRGLIPAIFVLGLLTSCSSQKKVAKYNYLLKNQSATATTSMRPGVTASGKDVPGKLVGSLEELNKTPRPRIKSAKSVAVRNKSTKSVKSAKAVRKETTKVIRTAESYIGTPYKYGGISKRGIDCSGLMCQSYKSVNKTLPRTTKSMSQSGKNIPLRKVKEGDLVFFSAKNRRGIDHVGLVTDVRGSKITFIHSTSSRGVRKDSLEDPYWKKRFRRAVSPK